MKAVAAGQVEKGKGASPVKPRNALTMLAAEHQTLLRMFRDYERGRGAGTRLAKGKLALRICHLLSLHAVLEEEIFYPAVARALGAKAEAELVESKVEHTVMKNLIVDLEGMSVENPAFDATLKVLAAQARRHFAEEEDVLFPLVRKSKLDVAGIGEQLAARELQLATRPPGKRTFREGRRVLGA